MRFFNLTSASVAGLLMGWVLGGALPAAADTLFVDDDALNDPGPGDPSSSDPDEDGTADHPFDAIQEAIDAAFDTDVVVVLDGTYTGTGNRNLDFGGRAITVRSQNGPDGCTIDCQGSGRGFYFHSGETADSVVHGFTITNGGIDEGAGVCSIDCSPIVSNCKLVQNCCSFKGGAVKFEGGSPTIVNCYVDQNSSTWYAGGILCNESNVTIVNCTVTGNTAGFYGGGIACVGGNVDISNCILWGNSCPNGPQLALSWAVLVSVSYCTVQGGEGAVHVDPDCTLDWGDGNLEGDPQLDADDRPEAGSPCIDAGDNDAVPDWVTTDLDGGPRFVDDPVTADTGNPGTSGPPIVDMGAYEFQVLVGDFNGDGSVDLDDYGLIGGCFTGPRPLSPADYDANGVVDLEDFAWWEPCLAGPDEAPGDGCDMMDLHRDNDVDLTDYAAFQRMFDFSIEPLSLECEPTDLDYDLDVDFGDFATFQASFTG